MPLRSTTSCEPTFDDTRVPAGNVLGTLGGDLSLGMAAINAGCAKPACDYPTISLY
jgi:acyl-CoA dehydrogenase